MTTETLTMPEVEITVEPPAKKAMKAEKSRERAPANGSSQLAGTIWFMGWLFTIGFAKLVWWKAILAVCLWPYFLGTAIH